MTAAEAGPNPTVQATLMLEYLQSREGDAPEPNWAAAQRIGTICGISPDELIAKEIDVAKSAIATLEGEDAQVALVLLAGFSESAVGGQRRANRSLHALRLAANHIRRQRRLELGTVRANGSDC